MPFLAILLLVVIGTMMGMDKVTFQQMVFLRSVWGLLEGIGVPIPGIGVPNLGYIQTWLDIGGINIYIKYSDMNKKNKQK